MSFRRKRRDTRVGTIEAQYGINFNRRSDMKLGTLLKETGASSLTELIRHAKSEQPPWQIAERAACKLRGMSHAGGSGAPDCASKGKVVDVKHQRRPVNRTQIVRSATRPWAAKKQLEVVSASGFTKGARAEAAARIVKLNTR